MSVLKRITSRNIQAHEEVIIDLPKTGLVRFRGENSEGKSVIVKALNAVISCTLNRKTVRNPLINYGVDEAQLILERYDGITLLANIHRESSKTYYELSIPGEQPLRRYISDKNLGVIIERFRFHYSEEREVSLNVYNTYDPLLFLTTSSRTNFDVLNSAISDPYVERSIEGIEVALKQLEITYQQVASAINHAEGRLTGIVVWNIDHEKARKERLQYLANNIQLLETPDLPDIKPIPDLGSIEALDTTDLRASIDQMIVVDNHIHEVLNQIDKIVMGIMAGKRVLDINIEHDADVANEFQKALDKEECPVCARGYKLA
jgi:hypothetical protein